jgi:hypothetical protein
MIGKLVVAACIAFGFHYAVKYAVNTTATAQLGDRPQGPVMPTVDPAALRQALAVGRAVDTTAQREAIDGAARRIDEMNRNMPLMPPNIPGMPRR